MVLERDPTNGDALVGTAQLAYWDGRTGEAIAGYERALSYRPNDVSARSGLAQVYLAAGRQLDAQAEADSAVAIAPANREAVRVQTSVGRTVQSAADLTLGWSDDSDDNVMWWQVVSATTPLSNRVRGFGSVGAFEGSSTPAVTAARGTAEWGATYTQDRWQLTGAFGVQGLWPDAGVARSVLTGRLGATYRFQPAVAVGVSYAHFPFAETAYLIGAGIDIDAVDATVDATLGSGLSLSAGGGAGWYSDGNQRGSAVLAVTKQLPRHFFVGGLARMVWYCGDRAGLLLARPLHGSGGARRVCARRAGLGNAPERRRGRPADHQQRDLGVRGPPRGSRGLVVLPVEPARGLRRGQQQRLPLGDGCVPVGHGGAGAPTRALSFPRQPRLRYSAPAEPSGCSKLR